MQDTVLNGVVENAKEIENNGQWMAKEERPYIIWKSVINYILLPRLSDILVIAATYFITLPKLIRRQITFKPT